jgi:hypothetical protein
MGESEIHRELRDAILARRFELDDGHVDIHVWAPVTEDEAYTQCDWQIVGLGSDAYRYSAGVDKVQAMIHALYAINTRLYSSNAWKEGRLTWLGMRDLGLPSLPGDRPLDGGYGPAELLSLPGWQAVVQIPDQPMPYFALSDEHLASLVRSLKHGIETIDRSPEEAKAHLERLVDGLLKEKAYYEAVCRDAGFPPPADHGK